MSFNTRLFSQNVTLRKMVSRDMYNEITYSAPITLKARLETSLEYRRDNFKELQISHSVYYLYSPAYRPRIEDLLKDENGDEYPIMTVLANKNFHGVTQYYTIVLGDRR